LANRSTPKGETSHQAVLQAAYQLFLENGYHATSIRDISRRSGLTIGGVYTHFADKSEIFRAVLDEYHPFWKILPTLEAAQGETVEALAYDMATRMVAVLGRQREAFNLIFIEVVEFHGRHFGEMFPQFFPRLIPMITRLISPQAENLRPIPTPVLVRSFFGLFISYFMTSVILNNELPSDDQSLHAFVDIYLHGILTEPTSPVPVSAGEAPSTRQSEMDRPHPPIPSRDGDASLHSRK
jgi:AcrR family transcriptional regulator